MTSYECFAQIAMKLICVASVLCRGNFRDLLTLAVLFDSKILLDSCPLEVIYVVVSKIRLIKMDLISKILCLANSGVSVLFFCIGLLLVQ